VHMVPDVWRQGSGFLFKCLTVFMDLKTLKDETTTLFWNVGSQIPSATVSHSRRTDTWKKSFEAYYTI
jgi:hypothetical protein